MSKTKLTRLATLLPACTVTRGRQLSGAGPARYGYFARTAAGQSVYLGRTYESARLAALRMGASYGARPA